MSFSLEEHVAYLMTPISGDEFEKGMKRLAQEAPAFYLEVFRLTLD